MKWHQDLDKDIRLHDYRDDLDYPLNPKQEFVFKNILPAFSPWKTKHDFSIANQNALKNVLTRLDGPLTSILEIGVSRDRFKWETSTGIFLDYKSDDCVYLGVDIEDKSFLDDPEKNIYTIQSDSGDIESITNMLDSLGVEQLDFIMIDGWHSINQVLQEWEYTSLLSDHGIVAFHDVAYHPGPHLFVNNLNTTKWNVIPNLCALDKQDFGIGFAWKR